MLKMKTKNKLMMLMLLALAFCVVVMPAQAAAAPYISSISPTSQAAGNFYLVVNGSGFVPFSMIYIYWQADGHYVGTGTPIYTYSNQIMAYEKMTGATKGNYIVKVRNPGGSLSNGKILKIY